MKVLAIDPGYERLGIAVLEGKTPNEKLLYSDCFTTDKVLPFEERLSHAGNEVTRLIKKYEPETMALEKVYFGNNQKTALLVSEVRGMLRFLAKDRNLPIYEYTPLQIKNAVTGNGRSDKRQVISMVEKLIAVKKEVKYDDEYDAIAVGITCLASERF